MQNPKVAAIIGICSVLLSALGLFTPRGKPFVFTFQVRKFALIPARSKFDSSRQSIIEDFLQYVQEYAVPRWHLGAYLILAIYIAVAADNGVKYSTLCRIRSALGLRAAAARASGGGRGGRSSSAARYLQRAQPNPPFSARFVVCPQRHAAVQNSMSPIRQIDNYVP